jgi:Ricin-type beta-trefoil lectin domain
MIMRTRVLCAAVASAALLIGPAVGEASAATSTIRDVATLRCLDSNLANSVYTLPCNGGNFQNWVFAGSGTTSTVRDVSTGFCLDSNTSGQVYAIPCNGGNFQRWEISRSGGRFVDAATGRCLDSNTDGRVYTLPCNEGNFQNWYHG